jgi:hypothetical protein
MIYHVKSSDGTRRVQEVNSVQFHGEWIVFYDKIGEVIHAAPAANTIRVEKA